MHFKHWLGAAAIAGLTFTPVTATAQEPAARQDSLAQIIRVLTARLDSLERMLDSLVTAGQDNSFSQ